jgi:PHD/YefM family antitoxin component YafN of YafNO toxin-antitoxin module
VGLGGFMNTIHVELPSQIVDNVLSQAQGSVLLVNSVGKEFVVMSKKEWDSLHESLTKIAQKSERQEAFAQECDDAMADYQHGNVGARGLEATLRFLDE